MQTNLRPRDETREDPARRGPGAAALDPADWDAAKRLGRDLVDELFGWLSTVRERPVWRPVPDAVRARLSAPLPRRPQGLEGALADMRRDILPYPYGNVHPRFWGWVNGSALVGGILGDLVASSMNSNVGAFDHAGTYVEEQVVAWCKELLDYAPDADGVLTSGGSLANLYALAAARSAKLDFDVRRKGLFGAARTPTVYCSLETHHSIQKAIEVLGIGSEQMRQIPVDRDYRVDVRLLADAIARDRAAGLQPLAVVGNAGTVNTGAIDDLEALADLCQAEGLWLHVDGAFGALAWLDPRQRSALRGLQRADSIAFDLHKWMYLSSDVGCLIVRDPDALQRTFAHEAAYLTRMRGGIASRTRGAFMDRGIELTRRFRALKVWIALKEHGLDAFAQAIARNLDQAQHLVRLVTESAALQLVAPAALNVVCFRYVTEGLTTEELNDLNHELLVRLQEQGTAVPSHTTLGDVFALRVAITNHRSESGDFDLLVDEVIRLGDALAAAALEAPLCGGKE